MIKRWRGVFLWMFCVALAAPFWGCGHSAPPHGLTLQLATWGSASEIAVLKPLLSRFEATHPGVRVALLHVPEYYYPKLHLLMAAKLPPDVMLMGSDMMPVYADTGQLRNLASDVSPQKRAAFYPQVMAAFAWPRKHDQAVSVSTLYALPRDVSDLVLFVNVDWFRRAGVPLPDQNTTWQDVLAFSPTLLKVAQTTPAYAISFHRTPALYWLPFAWSWGGRGIADVQTPADLLHDPLTCQGLQFYVDLVHKHHLAPSRQAAGTTPMTDRFLAGQLAMMINGRWAVPILREKATFHWMVAPFPQGPAGSRVGVDSAGYAVSAFSRHPQAALALARFLTSAEAMAAFAQSGLVIPARKAIMPADGVARIASSATRPPRHGGLSDSLLESPFIQALETGVPTQTGPRWHRLSEGLNHAIEPVWESGGINCERDE